MEGWAVSVTVVPALYDALHDDVQLDPDEPIEPPVVVVTDSV